MSMDKSQQQPTATPTEAAPGTGHTVGEGEGHSSNKTTGWRQLRSKFSATPVSFRLYMNPNKMQLFQLAVLLTTLGGAAGYIAYAKAQQRSRNEYTVILEDGSLAERKRTSRWD